MATTSPLSPGDHYFEADGVRFHYFVQGAGPLFVLVTVGWGAGGAYLRHGLGPRLEPKHTVVYVDPRGNGESGEPADAATMTAGTMAEDLELLREHLGVDAFPALLGHSHAGGVVLRYAERRPARVGRLVLLDAQVLDAPAGTHVADWMARREGVEAYAAASEQLRALGGAGPFPTTDDEFAAALDRLLPWYFSDAAKTDVLRAHLAAGPGRPRVYALQTNAHDAAPANKLPHLAEAGKVEARTLVLWGEEDPILDVETGRALAGRIRGARLAVLEGVGHFPWIEAPEKFWAALEAFMES